MRYALTDIEWRIIQTILPNKSRPIAARYYRPAANFLTSLKLLAAIRLWLGAYKATF